MHCHECALEALGTAQALLQQISALQLRPDARWIAIGHINTAVATLAADVGNRALWAPAIATLIAWKNDVHETPSPRGDFEDLVGEISAIAASCDAVQSTNRKRKR